jgi:hypothetical protein
MHKYKIPGIELAIVGNPLKNGYKVRITGARNEEQLNQIMKFIIVVLGLYVDAYLEKRSDKKYLIDKLVKLTHIAKRRKKVDNYVDYDHEKSEIKQMSSLDKERLGYTPEKGQLQYSRACQNNGGKIRRPQQVLTQKDLIDMGYKFNDKTKQFEKKVKSVQGNTIVIVPVELPNEDGTRIYYVCDPKINGEYSYVGVLTKSNNPYGKCMPCCFKKNQAYSVNTVKRQKFLNCLKGEEKQKTETITTANIDKIYVLRNTNKLVHGRFSLLSLKLDIFLNKIINNRINLKNNYLSNSNTGYFLKYGIVQDNNNYFNCFSAIFDISVDEIKNKIKLNLNKDKDLRIFTSLNNGDLRTQYQTKDKYLNVILNSERVGSWLLNDILSINGILSKNGLNIILFKKKIYDEENITIKCVNSENNIYLDDVNRENVIIIKENNYYYPIFLVKMTSDKEIMIKKKFTYDEIKHIIPYILANCNSKINKIGMVNGFTAKETEKIILNNKLKHNITYQIIDARFKCKYLILNDDIVIPVIPSGTLYNINTKLNVEEFVKSLSDTLNKLSKLYSDIVKIIGYYYTNTNNEQYEIIGLMTKEEAFIPIKPKKLSKSEIPDNMILMYRPPIDEIDEEILKGKKNIIVDKRIIEVNKYAYNNEMYQLFRYHFSNYLKEHQNIKEDLINLINNNNHDQSTRRGLIKKLLYQTIDKTLYEKFTELTLDNSLPKWIHLMKEDIEYDKYEPENIRNLCSTNKNKTCSNHLHCQFVNDECLFRLKEENIIDYVNKITEEFINNDFKAKEVLQIDKYYVSDIININNFTQRPKQKIIKESAHNIVTALDEYFGEEQKPRIGRYQNKFRYKLKDKEDEINKLNSIKEYEQWYTQNIIPNNYSVYRVFVNCYFWMNYPELDINSRNLGYYGIIQTELTDRVRGMVIDSASKFGVNVDKIDKIVNVLSIDDGTTELFVMSKIFKKFIYIYDYNNKIVKVINPNKDYNSAITEYLNDKVYQHDKNINLREVINIHITQQPYNYVAIYIK